MMEFSELLNFCREHSVNVRSDSREVHPGDIFVAVPGEKEDGADFIPQAARAGAAFIVCCGQAARDAEPSAFGNACRVAHENPRQALWQLAQARWRTEELTLEIIGITGTNGKTTSAFLLEHLFDAAGRKAGVLGTVDYRWPGHCQPAPLTTPDPLSLHEMLSQMSAAGADMAIMEVSSHSLEQQRVNGIPFVGAIFTNLTQDHLDFHKDMESYFRSKAKLFLELPKKEKKLAINSDDAYGRRLAALLPHALAFGLRQLPGRRQLLGKIIKSGINGLELGMELEGRSWILQSPLVGSFNALNLLGVQALALELGMAPEQFDALASFSGVKGRLERVRNNSDLHVFVDYAHTPDALINVLKALRDAGFKRIITVFGCGGNRDRAKRPLMGKAVAEFSDVAILTSDNPRYEKPEDIIDDVRPGLRGAQKTVVEADRRKATAMGLEMLGKDDALLIAGKGHEDYQLVRGEKHHYSDQEVVRELLNCA